MFIIKHILQMKLFGRCKLLVSRFYITSKALTDLINLYFKNGSSVKVTRIFKGTLMQI